ncbi:hypothetical protein EX30DRAFT_377766 [Ascodesmis nigricans]|uniref:Uncharacterized protein n=1 Tax=Ascodesmis nigricans TaxID=341454 RepID=A0A4S2MWU0_9PEZI|nr:hypothetical protein EX30DRAFT_377766 [Ascodesmis nigricans]
MLSLGELVRLVWGCRSERWVAVTSGIRSRRVGWLDREGVKKEERDGEGDSSGGGSDGGGDEERETQQQLKVNRGVVGPWAQPFWRLVGAASSLHHPSPIPPNISPLCFGQTPLCRKHQRKGQLLYSPAMIHLGPPSPPPSSASLPRGYELEARVRRLLNTTNEQEPNQRLVSHWRQRPPRTSVGFLAA